jgi:hypothetical protein
MATRSTDISRFPILQREWITSLNEKTLGDYKPASHEKVWWMCPVGHQYRRSIASRYSGGDCSFCSNDRVLAGFNDLESQFPEISAEWSKENNENPSEVLATSKRKFMWRCINNHNWIDQIYARTLLGRGCQYCGDKKVWTGFNDLKTVWPNVDEFWSSENEKRSDEVIWNSRKTAKWRCAKGHDWDARIYITLREKSCPFCEGVRVKAGFNSLDIDFANLLAEFVSTNRGERNPAKVLGKNSRVPLVWKCNRGHLEKQSLALFRSEFGCITCRTADKSWTWPSISQVERLKSSWHSDGNPGVDPADVSANSTNIYSWQCGLGHTWKASAQYRFRKFSECRFCSGKDVWAGFNDLASTFPRIAAEWNFSKNGSPSDKVHFGSQKNYWWICEFGHEWKASPNNRTRGRNGGTGCPSCANRRVEEGFNDLSTTHPELSQQWNYKKNRSLRPTQVIFKRKESCWWICTLGHEWQCPPRSRYRGTTLMGCPFCGNQKLLKGFNDLATRRPDLIEAWDNRKNKKTPSDFMFGSKEVVSWICPAGHQYNSSILARTYAKNNCPSCKPVLGETSSYLLSLHFEKLRLEWDLDGNGLSLQEALSGSRSERFLWICPQNGHSFKQILMKRIHGQNCPYCAGKAVLPGFNDLDTVAPELISSWDYVKNVGLLPSHFTKRSGKKVWWKCDMGHPSWLSSIAHRTDERPRGCPGCKSSGFNPSEPGYLYWLRHMSWGLFKIGITNSPSQRLEQHKAKGWQALEIVGPMDGYYTAELEADLLSVISRHTLTLGDSTIAGKFDGYTETWLIEDFVISSLSELREFLFQDEFAETNN